MQASFRLVAYGSLLSAHGLRHLGRLRLRSAHHVRLDNARRGFAKFAQRGDRFAMALDPIDPDAPLRGHLDAPDGVGATLYEIGREDLLRISRREGYAPEAVLHLIDLAEERGTRLEHQLWELYERAGFDLPAYRERLQRAVGYTSPHYIPHPMRIDAADPAIVFLAPGREGTGDPRIVSVRERTGDPPLMSVRRAWESKPNATQIEYFISCFLGAVHGVALADLLGDIDHAEEAREQVARGIAALRDEEAAQFHAAVDERPATRAHEPTMRALRLAP